ncbi:hypothetical protein ABZ626_38275 [Streptomyces longispororuber]|uniref:hypothetical protein n=1 Tax=Streptomyces longispororuber TaxID=68230 RepID=UPI0033F585E3
MAPEKLEQTEADGVITITAEQISGEVGAAAATGAWWAFFSAHRIFNLRINIPVVPGSLAWVSLSEAQPGSNTPFLGAATMHTYNVVPQDGFMMVRGEIDWDSDLLTRASIWLG